MFLSRFRWSAKRLRLLHDSLGSARLGSVLATVDCGLAPCAPASSCPKSFVLAAQHSQMPGIIIYELFTLSIFCSCYDQSNRRTDVGTIGSLSLSWAWHTPRSFAGSLTRWRSEPLFCCPKVSWQECYGRQVWPSCAAICTFGVRNLLGYRFPLQQQLQSAKQFCNYIWLA